MDAENFFSRWSRRKAQAAQERHGVVAEETLQARQRPNPHPHLAGQSVVQPGSGDGVQEISPPTMDDVAALTPDSDFSRFLSCGVDTDVRRSAMKKLFSDPHFHVMDGLDIYIDDYNKFQPMPAAMLAALNHAQGVLNPQPLFDMPPERGAAMAGEGVKEDDESTDLAYCDVPGKEETVPAAQANEDVGGAPDSAPPREEAEGQEKQGDTEDKPDHAD
jgi:hypothetical protein